MSNLIIKREKAMVGMAMPMICYVNNQEICRIKNGGEVICEVENSIIEFKCQLKGNPMSEVIRLDLCERDSVRISAKQGAWKPQITVLDQDALLGTSDKSLIEPKVESNQFVPTKVVGVYFGVDEVNKKWAVGKGLIPSLKKATPYNYDDIVDFELLEDGNSISKGGLGRAAVGGLLFGGAGAVVGSVTGRKSKQTCTNLSIKITVRNGSQPVEYIKIISSPVDKNSLMYKSSYQSAQEIMSLLHLMCNERDTERMTTNNTQPTEVLSSADEIRKYKALLEDGIISEEEFQAKKKQLLGI